MPRPEDILAFADMPLAIRLGLEQFLHDLTKQTNMVTRRCRIGKITLKRVA